MNRGVKVSNLRPASWLVILAASWLTYACNAADNSSIDQRSTTAAGANDSLMGVLAPASGALSDTGAAPRLFGFGRPASEAEISAWREFKTQQDL